jgi:hypothetical protein
MSEYLTRLDRHTAQLALAHRLTYAACQQRLLDGILPARPPDAGQLFREPLPRLPGLDLKLRYLMLEEAEGRRRHGRAWCDAACESGQKHQDIGRVAAALDVPYAAVEALFDE